MAVCWSYVEPMDSFADCHLHVITDQCHQGAASQPAACQLLSYAVVDRSANCADDRNDNIQVAQVKNVH